MKTLAILVAVVAAFVGVSSEAFAASKTTFALVVTNNRSPRLSRPDLKYADDDGAKYYEVLSLAAGRENTALLTTFDRDTEKLFPELGAVAKPPTKANVQAAMQAFAEKSRAALATGEVEFYFVFAGHGDIDRGKGFLELEDGPFTSDDLEALLRATF